MGEFKYDAKRDLIIYDGDVWKRVEWTEFAPRKDGEGACAVCNSLMYDGDQYCPTCGRKVAE